MPIHDILQGNYNTQKAYYQLKLPLDIDVSIADDDKVRLVDAFVNAMDLTELYDQYGRIVKKTADPRTMFKLTVFGMMNHIYSSRELETACRKNIDFMFLLNGLPVPDHATFARFISEHFCKCSQNILVKVVQLLKDLGEISGKTIFIDGTKIEAYANKYTFVWKKAVTKNMEKMAEAICAFVEKCEKDFLIQLTYGNELNLRLLKKLRKKLYKIKNEQNVEFVHGSGKRKTAIQKAIETLENYIERAKGYIMKKHLCGERNSYSKTDTDATFMRMKEDYMKNGQLKPAYNVQHGVDAEYIVWADISAHPTDTLTLKPFLKQIEEKLGFKYDEIVADAGYESEENYVFIEANEQEAYIKPSNYEISKKRTYKTDIGRFENMTYNEEKDIYTCKNGKELKASGTKKRKSASGYISETTIYTCSDCKGCPYKAQCIKGNHCKTPMEDRNKALYISKKKEELRKKDLERILSDRGVQLRVNRSIQVEGSFATIKEDMGFRRYSYRGHDAVLSQTVLVAIAHNLNKLHNKIQGKRTGTHLFDVKTAA